MNDQVIGPSLPTLFHRITQFNRSDHGSEKSIDRYSTALFNGQLLMPD